jgi:hypothetical protein
MQLADRGKPSHDIDPFNEKSYVHNTLNHQNSFDHKNSYTHPQAMEDVESPTIIFKFA